MPGLVGFTDRHARYDSQVLSKMLRLLKHFDWYCEERLFEDQVVCATRTHLGLTATDAQPYTIAPYIFCWLEGEFYNREELALKYGLTYRSDGQFIVKAYAQGGDLEFLKDIDGCFCAVVYDSRDRKLYLITDRYGFKPFMWGMFNDNLVWSSELKGFLGHPDFVPVIDRRAIEEFFGFGYVLENRTWFENIEWVPPASVLTFDISEGKHDIRHYWSWSEISLRNNGLVEAELIEELGFLMRCSIERRIKEHERIGLGLSGGLDSRAVLACCPRSRVLHAFTVGQQACDDLEIAKKVSSIDEVPHHELNLNEQNWFIGRPRAIWQSDAMGSLLHMHEAGIHQVYRSYVDFMLYGFGGDLILGGSHLRHYNLDRMINSLIVSRVTGSEVVVTDFDSWYLIDKTDPYFINNRMRKFTNCGITLSSKWTEVLLPLCDNKLVDFIYSLPDALRRKGYIYRKTLSKTFPRYFAEIPWHKTGFPAGYFSILHKIGGFSKRGTSKFRRELSRFNLNFRDTWNYTDYGSWIRQSPARKIFQSILLNRNAIYPAYIDINNVKTCLAKHMDRKANCHEELSLMLTFELWLQQVFEGQYRTADLSLFP